MQISISPWKHPKASPYMNERICLTHIIDPVLASHVADRVTARDCTYCGKAGAAHEPPFAVPMDDAARHVFDAANWLYHDGYDEFFHEGWPEQYSTDFLIEDCTARAFDTDVIEEMATNISDSIATPEAWLGSGLRDDFLFSWEAFARTVRYQSRFVYIGSSSRAGHEKEPPSETLTIPRRTARLRAGQHAGRNRPGGSSIAAGWPKTSTRSAVR